MIKLFEGPPSLPPRAPRTRDGGCVRTVEEEQFISAVAKLVTSSLYLIEAVSDDTASGLLSSKTITKADDVRRCLAVIKAYSALHGGRVEPDADAAEQQKLVEEPKEE